MVFWAWDVLAALRWTFANMGIPVGLEKMITGRLKLS